MGKVNVTAEQPFVAALYGLGDQIGAASAANDDASEPAKSGVWMRIVSAARSFFVRDRDYSPERDQSFTDPVWREGGKVFNLDTDWRHIVPGTVRAIWPTFTAEQQAVLGEMFGQMQNEALGTSW